MVCLFVPYSTVMRNFEKNCTAYWTGKHCPASYWVPVNVDSVAVASSWYVGVKGAACIADSAAMQFPCLGNT